VWNSLGDSTAASPGVGSALAVAAAFAAAASATGGVFPVEPRPEPCSRRAVARTISPTWWAAAALAPTLRVRSSLPPWRWQLPIDIARVLARGTPGRGRSGAGWTAGVETRRRSMVRRSRSPVATRQPG